VFNNSTVKFFVGILILGLFACQQKPNDEELFQTITTPAKTGYWDIAGGVMSSSGDKKFYLDKLEYSKKTGRYFDCHRFKSDGTMTEMHYDLSDSASSRIEDWNGDIPTTKSWAIENGKFILGSDTFNILKCDADSFIVKSDYTSIIYVKSKMQ
jgi:hypothetical protein